jgi:hypothetical protein
LGQQNKENYSQLSHAFAEFGLPLFDMTESKFLDTDAADVFSYGRPPVSIDIITKLKGVEFDNAFPKAQFFNEEGLEIRFLHLNNLTSGE